MVVEGVCMCVDDGGGGGVDECERERGVGVRRLVSTCVLCESVRACVCVCVQA